METFIDEVVEFIKNKEGDSFRSTCIVFPTRRACLIFRNRFAATLNKPVWSPGILSIGDFVNRHSKLPVTEDIPLLITLFEVYKKYWPEQDFGKFYPWGQMLLNDFDEIDKQLSDPSRIFMHINELKKIDATFFPDPASMSWIRDFISSMDENKLTRLQEKFADTWNKLQKIHFDFNNLLNQKGFAYEGKAYLQLIHEIKSGKFKSAWKQFVFAGFYGFSRTEEELVKKLSVTHKVDFIWDADPYYIKNKKHEAGYYFRKSPLTSNKTDWGISHFEKNKKNITITGVPLVAGQAKFAGQLLFELMQHEHFDIGKTAIILPDENMLFPVLFSLPESIESVNVTMGYPLQQSQYQELLKVLYDLFRNTKFNSQNEIVFHHRFVKRVLSHPLFRGKVDINIETNHEKGNYLNAGNIAEIYGINDPEIIFSEISDAGSLFVYLRKLLIHLRESLLSRDANVSHFEDKIIEYIILELGVLREQLEDHLWELTAENCWQMVKECISGLKVPFSGEPVKGLQVMGFLETRALDFETVIILNVNEGILPATSANKSFIPFAIRKAYGLSTYEDQDASFAYHFYRLLHKSINVHLVFNTEVDKTNGGEPGRYLLQIKQELAKTFGANLNISETTIKTPIIPEVIPPISIVKQPEILEKLKEYIVGTNGESQRYFSSSAITSYIQCSLRFYYRYIANLLEKETEEESIEDHTFGSILHKTLELLYKDVQGITDEHTIDHLISNVDNALEKAIKEIFHTPVTQLEGADILLAEVIRELVRRILVSDRSDVPFQIKGLEAKFKGSIPTEAGLAGLYGNIDRVDEKDSVTRIIDYKTGKVDLKIKTLEQVFIDPDKKPVFQLYFYALLYGFNFPNDPVKTGFYLARNLINGITWSDDGIILTAEKLLEFRNLLSQKIDEIMNPLMEFSQTTEIKRCEYCSYKVICNR